MNIQYHEKEQIFTLNTPETTYMLGIVDRKYLGHIYYGPKINDHHLAYTLRLDEIGLPSHNPGSAVGFFDELRCEYSTHGLGDFRESCLQLETEGGMGASQLTYLSHKIYAGKPTLSGLPATYGSANDCTTLEITMQDFIAHIQVTLFYTAFHHIDAITRNVIVKNIGETSIQLKKALSFALDMDNDHYDMITLHGTWANERGLHCRNVGYGKQSIGSTRGISSHQENPFLAVTTKNASEEHGEVYGFNLIYSGNFLGQVERAEGDHLRIVMGIHPDNFSWKLDASSIFTTPEAVLVYSNNGLGKMTRTFHDLYRNHLIRGKYQHTKRPILLNNWEATYFDFTTDRLLELAQKASQVGIEMLVVDDGWFGNRQDDSTSLGDWIVNETKLPGGFSYLAQQLEGMNMKLGIWMEPEMVSKNSDTFRQHPDWIIQIPNREPLESRNQYVLDFSRKEVRDYIYHKIYQILNETNISYVKWDMNRTLTDLSSGGLSFDCQGELSHRYLLGVYEIQEKLIEDFPNILLENCASGGGRFDPGMLYYSPQIWTSDNTDAISRLSIQRGTSLVYPLSSIGSHVSDCPNHQVGRTTPLSTRGHVALAGTFGYEMDVTKLSPEELQEIGEQVDLYHKHHILVATGDYYRLANQEDTHEYDCTIVVSKDKSEALVTFVQTLRLPAKRSKRIKCLGLDPDAIYQIDDTSESYSGSALLYAGLPIPILHKDFESKLIYFHQKRSD